MNKIDFLNSMTGDQLAVVNEILEEEKMEVLKDFRRSVVEAGLVDETDFNYFCKEYDEESSETK